jgi:hypothetical protein
VDPVSLVAGAVLLAVVAWWLLVGVSDTLRPAVGWLVAAGLILLGGLGVIVNLRADLHRPQPAQASPPNDD